MESNLFRKKSIRNSENFSNKILLNLKFPIKYYLIIIFIIIFFIIGLIIFGNYDKKIVVSGFVNPINGIFYIRSNKEGRISKFSLKEGDFLKKNDIILEIKDGNSVNNNLILLKKKIELEKIIENQNLIGKNTELKLKKNIESLKNQINYFLKIVKEEKIVLKKLESQKNTYTYLGTKNAVSKDEVLVKSISYSQQKLALFKDEFNLSYLKNQLNTEEKNLSNFIFEQNNVINELNLRILDLEKNKLDFDNNQMETITSPINGKITSIVIINNQPVRNNDYLFTIVGYPYRINIQLYVDGDYLRYIKKGDVIFLNFNISRDSTFKKQKGIISEITLAPVNSSEIKEIKENSTKTNNLLYRLTVVPEKQYVLLNKDKYMLIPYTRVTSNIIIKKRKIYQAIFDFFQNN